MLVSYFKSVWPSASIVKGQTMARLKALPAGWFKKRQAKGVSAVPTTLITTSIITPGRCH